MFLVNFWVNKELHHHGLQMCAEKNAWGNSNEKGEITTINSHTVSQLSAHVCVHTADQCKYVAHMCFILYSSINFVFCNQMCREI